MSSVSGGYSAETVDEVDSTCAVTNYMDNPWWAVNIGVAAQIVYLVITSMEVMPTPPTSSKTWTIYLFIYFFIYFFISLFLYLFIYLFIYLPRTPINAASYVFPSKLRSYPHYLLSTLNSLLSAFYFVISTFCSTLYLLLFTFCSLLSNLYFLL